MKPVTVDELVSVFRANHISLRNEHGCSSPPLLAEASNMSVNPKREETVNAREGDVICTIEPVSKSAQVRRRHYSGDQMTYLTALNVVCAVFPSDDVHASRQIGSAEQALHKLVLRHSR